MANPIPPANVTSSQRALHPARREINAFVAAHQLAWDLTMAVLALAYVGLGFVEDSIPTAVYERWFAPVEIVITLVFIAEFVSRIWAAESRLVYLRHHWIDLVALLPAVRLLRFLRAARFLRVAEIARALEAARLLRLGALVRLLAEVERIGHRITWIAKHNGVHVFLSFALGLTVVGGAGVWQLEHASNPEFHQLGNAMWWAFATMATVGYGNGPSTLAGRIIAGLLMVIGIGCFGLMTATVTTLFIERTHGPEVTANELKAMLVEISTRLESLERELREERAKNSVDPRDDPPTAEDANDTNGANGAPPKSPIPATVPMWVEGPGELRSGE